MSPNIRLRAVAIVAVLALSAGFATAAAEAQTPAEPPTVSATGSGIATVKPADRTSNASIVAAIERAEAAALPRAMRDARRRVTAVAQAAGLTLTDLLSVSEGPTTPYGPYFGPFGPTAGTFGPGRYCGNVPRFRTKRLANGKTRRVRSGTRRACRFPGRVTASLTVTYATG